MDYNVLGYLNFGKLPSRVWREIIGSVDSMIDFGLLE